MMRQIPFAFQWIIPENQLLALKDAINGKLESPSVEIITGVEYSLRIYPNGSNEDRRGETWIFLYLKLENIKRIKADYTSAIESAGFSEKRENVYEESIGWGFTYCKTVEFFNAEKKFIIDGKFTAKINGIFEFDDPDFHGALPLKIEEQIWDGGKLGDELWSKNDGKDFKIFADKKEINVHKLVLQNRSPAFAKIFESDKENKLEIIEFSLNVVETGIKLLYDCNFKTSLSMDDKMALLQFFEKYDVPSLKDKIEPLLIDLISAATVCRLTNCSIFTNSKKLEVKCMEFLMESFAAKTPLSDIGILDKNIALKILQNSLFHTVIQSE